MPEPVNVFCSYSHRDDAFREQLETHLSSLKREGLIRMWTDRQIGAGQDWRATIHEQLEAAHLVLLLVSADFIDSGFCFDIELKRAIERHRTRDARVIPVIVRDCDWHGTPLAALQALPRDALAVKNWSDRDTAWASVARGIRAAVEELRRRPPPPPAERPALPPSTTRDELVEVRRAYRRIHAHHRWLFDLVDRSSQAVSSRFGNFAASWWGPYMFSRPPTKHPTRRWVYDFVPLAHAYFAWASAEQPEAGAYHWSILHTGDDAVDAAPRTKEPDPSRFPAAEASRTLLSVYVKAIPHGAQRFGASLDWEGVETLMGRAPGFQDAQWRDAQAHAVEVSAGTVRFGGFERDAMLLLDDEAAEQQLIQPLLSLIERVRAA
ncbi:toll/interleukin-1 receptor domain-containing protein [Sorangium sp. So ce861]|uniref:toll/interleukin-1 receptor domain-containing protein n=1 Tax=Sorangium sp. So ce861 TaxID=3133323 RepID=UPI003F63106C